MRDKGRKVCRKAALAAAGLWRGPHAAAAAAAAHRRPLHLNCRRSPRQQMPTTRSATRKMSGVENPLHALGQDLLNLALARLAPSDLLACALVCRGWRDLLAGAHGDSLWQAHCQVGRGSRGGQGCGEQGRAGQGRAGPCGTHGR